MVETIEYIIGFAVSTSIAVFSIFVLSGAAPILGMFISNSAQAQVADSAREAVLQNASVSVSLDLSGTSVTCQHGVLTVAGPAGSHSSEVGADCSFSISGVSGAHKLVFTPTGSRLLARVEG